MWHIRTILIVLMGISLVLVPGLRADSLQLKNGNFVQGKYLGGTERAVEFEVNGKIRLYGIDEILSINFAAASADGGIPSNDDEQKLRTNTGSNFVDRGKGGSHTVFVNYLNVSKPLSRRTSRIQNQNSRCQQTNERTGKSSRSSCADSAPNAEPRARITSISDRCTRFFPASSWIISD